VIDTLQQLGGGFISVFQPINLFALVVGLVVRLTSHGPALFRQDRVGLDGRSFKVVKFRTMVADAPHLRGELDALNEGDGLLFKIADDPRVTTVGRFLRRTSIDELPQLVNVLKGDMSIVGPRPHALAHDEYYGALIPTYAARFRARPGLTGYAQVNGFRGEIRDTRGMSDRVAADNP